MSKVSPVGRSSEHAEIRLPVRERAGGGTLKPGYDLERLHWRMSSPFGGMNPTAIHFKHKDLKDVKVSDQNGAGNGNANGVKNQDGPAGSSASSGDDQPETQKQLDTEDGDKHHEHDEAADDVNFKWTSRNNRKGRHQLEFTPAKDPNKAKYVVPEQTSTPREVMKIILRMFTDYPVWDVSWLVAYIFVWGSIVWVINAFFAWLPVQDPSTEFSTEVYYGGGITAFIGATIFEIGSVLLMLEAINENRSGCFGWAVEKLIEEGEDRLRLTPKRETCQHHHANKKNFVGKSAMQEGGNEKDERKNNFSHPGTDRSWTWYPTFSEFSTHFIYEIGFLACAAQLFGATIFWISGFTALPGIYNHLVSWASQKGAYLVPQIIGGSGFVVSGTLFMLETQEKWWKPALGTLGWHIGLWNLIGGIGFMICPIFGLYPNTSFGPYQEALSTFWGSWAFLVASLAQLYESLQKYPVSHSKEKKN